MFLPSGAEAYAASVSKINRFGENTPHYFLTHKRQPASAGWRLYQLKSGY